MNRLNRTGLFYTPIVALSLVLAPAFARADDLTGLPVDDPKDLSPAPTSHAAPACAPTGEMLFVPMPAWTHGVTFATMPEQLKPMGKKSLAASGPVVPKVTPPKDESATSTTNGVETTTAGGKASENSPAMITVSPFLQWIKANPQAAATAARQQADAYHAAAPGPGAPPPVSSVNDQSYWLPPLIDSADFGTKPIGRSAAIYSTPQR